MHGLNSRGMQLLLQLHARAQLFRTQPAVLSRDLCPCTACTNGRRSAHDHCAKKCELCWCRICMGETGGADSYWHAGTLRKNPWRICMDSAGSRCRVELLDRHSVSWTSVSSLFGAPTTSPLSFLPPQYGCDSVCLRDRSVAPCSSSSGSSSLQAHGALNFSPPQPTRVLLQCPKPPEGLDE